MGRMRPDEKTRKMLAIVRECLSETTFLKVARQTGLNPSHLYRAFGNDGNPCVSTFFNVCDALDMDIRLVPREPKAEPEGNEAEDGEGEGEGKNGVHEPVAEEAMPSAPDTEPS